MGTRLGFYSLSGLEPYYFEDGKWKTVGLKINDTVYHAFLARDKYNNQAVIAPQWEIDDKGVISGFAYFVVFTSSGRVLCGLEQIPVASGRATFSQKGTAGVKVVTVNRMNVKCLAKIGITKVVINFSFTQKYADTASGRDGESKFTGKLSASATRIISAKAIAAVDNETWDTAVFRVSSATASNSRRVKWTAPAHVLGRRGVSQEGIAKVSNRFAKGAKMGAASASARCEKVSASVTGVHDVVDDGVAGLWDVEAVFQPRSLSIRRPGASASLKIPAQ